MDSSKQQIKYLKDYQQPNFWIDDVNLHFNIQHDKVIVTANTKYKKNTEQVGNSLVLLGSSELVSMHIDGTLINCTQIGEEEFLLENLPNEFNLTVVTNVDSFNNKSCMGLYESKGNLFTQCESQGFRKITHFLDRPDVMGIYTVAIEADKTAFPILLSNGNKISEKELENNRQEVIWHDPFRKPSYLFALVAGNLAKISDTFTTKSGRTVNLEVYSEESNINDCHFSLKSLANSMKWDEDKYNLEYDLDTYMIVATSDFNMGAMENKGLNVFNTKYVVANTNISSDDDFINVEAVVGHEYFHNWTGNRVTCRDWFQLSLKEGLTVFREQEFTADLNSRPVKRIEDVKLLRQNQFTEDNSALAHSVRPEEYIEINNFYTMTIYEKGAEVVRMYQTILGKEKFSEALSLYLKTNDGKAATCEDFFNAMNSVSPIDLSQFFLWYQQAGTPRITVEDSYDPLTYTYRLKIRQDIPNTPHQSNKKAMLIPIKTGLLNSNGKEITKNPSFGKYVISDGELVLLLTDFENEFIFDDIAHKPTPSLLRDLSAPVIMNDSLDNPILSFLALHDTNSFNRWESLQKIFQREILKIYTHLKNDTIVNINEEVYQIIEEVANNQEFDPHVKSLMLMLPGFNELSFHLKQVDPSKLMKAINLLKYHISFNLLHVWKSLYKQNRTVAFNKQDIGRRALKNCALHYIIRATEKSPFHFMNMINDYAVAQFDNADNMTDRLAVLNSLNNIKHDVRDEILAKFYERYKNSDTAIDKWFSIQSQSRHPNTIAKIEELMLSPMFKITTPNKVYALLRTFTKNSLHFNTKEGYELIARVASTIDKFNPQVASRLINGFSQVSELELSYKKLAKATLQNLLAEKLSSDTYEVTSKIFAEL